ncbi:LPS assembly lipoprotein LptE [Stappia indica]|uniref:LPS assembly lipoprotein LptE n=1 Tax=Stappia indica TaxID=538381 RepID=UPI0008295677|nr:LPS assembly lipoprotein LptE [Stappia indica]
MSSCDHQHPQQPARRRTLAVLVMGAALLAGACQVRPLYGTIGGPGGSTPAVTTELAAIDIDTVETASVEDLDRVGQVLRNELIFGFRRGREGGEPRYRLRILIDRPLNEVGVERLADVPSAYTVTVNASYVLSEIGTGRTVTTGRAFGSASFDFSSQRFANLRAERDAEDRAAKMVAADIQTRLAGFFASRG